MLEMQIGMVDLEGLGHGAFLLEIPGLSLWASSDRHNG